MAGIGRPFQFRKNKSPTGELVREAIEQKENKMLINQDEQDILDQQRVNEYRLNQNALKSILNSARQLTALYTALSHRPGANVSPEIMADAVEGISALHKDITLTIGNQLIGEPNDIQVAMIGRAVAPLSGQAWISDMESEQAAEVFINLAKSIIMESPDKKFIADEQLRAALNGGSAAAKFMPVILKIADLKNSTQELYIGKNSPIEFSAMLTTVGREISNNIARQIASHANKEDLAIATLSINSVVSEVIAGACISEMNSLTRELRSMSNEDKTAYLKMIKELPKGHLYDRTISSALPFIESAYPGLSLIDTQLFDSDEIESDSPTA